MVGFLIFSGKNRKKYKMDKFKLFDEFEDSFRFRLCIEIYDKIFNILLENDVTIAEQMVIVALIQHELQLLSAVEYLKKFGK